MKTETNIVPIRQTDRTALYRHFDAVGDLLYVGVSLSPIARTNQHSQGAEWFRLIASVSIEWFDDRSAALDAECLAIFLDRPRFNTVTSLDRLRTFFCPLTDKPKQDCKAAPREPQKPEKYPAKKLIGFNQEIIDRIEDWRRMQSPIPNFSEAVRQIVDIEFRTSGIE